MLCYRFTTVDRCSCGANLSVNLPEYHLQKAKTRSWDDQSGKLQPLDYASKFCLWKSGAESVRKHSPGNVQHPVGKSLTYGGCRETTLLFTEVNPIEQTANWASWLWVRLKWSLVSVTHSQTSLGHGKFNLLIANHFPKKGSILTVLRSNYSF